MTSGDFSSTCRAWARAVSADRRRGCGVGFARRLVDHGAGEIGDASKAALGAPLFEPVDDRDDAGRIAENEIADHYRARAREHVFDHILDLDDAAAADDRNLHRFRALIDHAHDDRLDAGTRESAELVADRGPETVDVDLEAENGVRHHERVGARRFGRLGDGDDVAGVGRELAPDRLVPGPWGEAPYVEPMFLVPEGM